MRHRLPSIGESVDWPEAGTLMAYGPRQDDLRRQAATYVDRILKGAKPGDLPIGQPTTFSLILNLKTAKPLGLTIPPSILLRADHVIA
jgi:putative ABC transport system substrate-binding protein